MVGKRGVGAVLVMLVLLTSCNGFLSGPILWGRADTDIPVETATVRVAEAGTGRFICQGTVVGGNFLEKTSVWEFCGRGEDLDVTVFGGQGAKDGGVTLRAYVPGHAASQPIYVNLLTTLVAAYMDKAAVPYETAQNAVFDYLGIPRDSSIISEAHQGRSQAHFDPDQFVAKALENGGVNAYIDALAAGEIGVQSPQSFSALRAPSGEAPAPMESSLFDDISSGVLSGIGSFAAQQAIGWVLASFGYQDATDRRFNEIDAQLKIMNTKLNDIETDLNQVSQQVEAVLNAVNLSRDEVIQQVAGYSVESTLDTIKNQYDNLRDSFPFDDPQKHTQAGAGRAHEFAVSIATSGHYDFDQLLYNLNSIMLGSTPGTVGFLDACTNVLIDRAAAGEGLLDCYMVLENYFAEMLAVEGKGLVLMTEALHVLNNDLAQEDKDFTGSTAAFKKKFDGYISAQIEKFLSCVDRLVVSRANIRTCLVNQTQFLADGTATVYERADFLASRFSAAHPAGLVLRVIGTPADVLNLYNSGIFVAETVTDIHCSGFNGTTTVQSTELAVDPVPVNGAPYNAYPATLPGGYNNGYFEWFAPVGDTTNTFKVQKNIVVVKLVLTDKVLDSRSITLPRDCLMYKGPTHEVTWSMEPGLQGDKSGVPGDLLMTYDNTFQPAAEGTAYANVLVYRRQLPGAWSASTQWNSTQGGNTLQVAFDPASMSVVSCITNNDSHHSRSCSGVTGVCQDYWDIAFDIVSTQSILFEPASAVDVCNVNLAEQALIGLALSTKLDNSALTQKAVLGGTSSKAGKCGGTRSSTPNTEPPTQDTGLNTVTVKAATSTTIQLDLVHEVDCSHTFLSKPSSVQGAGHVSYTHLELYPTK